MNFWVRAREDYGGDEIRRNPTKSVVPGPSQHSPKKNVDRVSEMM